jgi:hypothetical protein
MNQGLPCLKLLFVSRSDHIISTCIVSFELYNRTRVINVSTLNTLVFNVCIFKNPSLYHYALRCLTTFQKSLIIGNTFEPLRWSLTPILVSL